MLIILFYISLNNIIYENSFVYNKIQSGRSFQRL